MSNVRWRSFPAGGSIGEEGRVVYSVCFESVVSLPVFNPSMEASIESPQSPRIQPAWIAAASGSVSSEYTSVPQTAQRRQTCSRSSLER